MKTKAILAFICITIFGCAIFHGPTLYLYEYETGKYAIEFKHKQFISEGHNPFPFSTKLSPYKYWLVVPDTIGKFQRSSVLWSRLVPDSLNTKIRNVPTEGWVEIKPGKVKIQFLADSYDNGTYKLIIVKGVRKLSSK
jgi:hypothetical protein